MPRRVDTATPSKWWTAAGIALLASAIAIRLGWEFAGARSIENFATICLSILAVVGIGGLLIFLVFRPEKLASWAFSGIAIVVVGLGLVGGLLHYLRFVFISETPALAIVIATALALASICGFVGMLYALRWLRLRGRRVIMPFEPIGVVRSPVKGKGLRDFDSVVSTVVVREELAEALDGVEGFSHIVVFYWFHLSERPTSLKVHPRGDVTIPQRGIFATCSPVRPNPIGMTVVRLLERRGNELRVQGLDALDGSPVLDIKPYIPFTGEAHVPSWAVGQEEVAR